MMVRARMLCSLVARVPDPMRVRIESDKGGLVETEAFLININPETMQPGATIISRLAPGRNEELIEELASRNITSVAMDTAPEELKEYATIVTNPNVENKIYWALKQLEIL